MGKNKSSSQQLKTAKSSKDAQVKAISSVKGGAITKPSQTPKSKSKEIAKVVALKADKTTKGDKKSKKAKKEPTPEPSSSEAEIDEAVTSASSESSGEESESETEPVQAVAKSNGTKANGSAKASTAVKAAEESSESSASSDDENDDEDDDEIDSEDDRHKPVIPNPVPVVVKKNGAAKHESGSEEDSEEDSEGISEEDKEVDSDEESDAVPGAADPKGLNGATKKVETQQSSDDNSDSEASSGSESGTDADSDSEKSLGEDIQEEAVASKKRKADIDPLPTVKKSKTEATGGDATKKNLFVGQLSWNVDEDWLTREFEPYGELTGVRIITDRNTGRSKGFGYVEFANSADAIKAQEEKHGASIDNRVINVDFSNPRADESSGYKERSKSHGDEKSPPSDTIFVANIPFGATEDMLGEEFGKHGSVIGIRLPTNPDDGRPKGFGYVQFSSVDEASEALKNMEGAFIGGRPLRLDFSTPRTNTGDSPRGGRGGRGGGRGFDRGRGGGGRGRGGFGGDRGGRGGRGGGRGGSTNRGGFGDFKGKKMTFN